MTVAIESSSPGFTTKIARFAGDIKISHTVFAMPWAVLAAVMAWRRVGGPVVGKLAIVVVCMIAARTAAMAANRLLDAELDRRNPRTARRAIPSGALSARFVGLAMLLAAGVFIAATAMFWFVYDNAW